MDKYICKNMGKVLQFNSIFTEVYIEIFMRISYLFALLSLLFLVGCSAKSEDIRKVLKICDDCYNAGDTTTVWPDAMKQADELVRNCDDEAVIGEYYYQKSCLDLSRGTGDSIAYYLKRSREYYRKSDDRENFGKVLLASAQFSNMMQLSDSVRSYALEGIEVTAGLPDLQGMLYGELLMAELSDGNMKKAVDYGKESLRLLKEAKDTASYILECGNVGVAYRRQGLNDSAMVLYNDGLQLALPFGDEATTAYLYNNLSVLYGDKNRIDEAISFAEKAIAYAERSGETVEKLSGIANKASMLLLKGDYDSAASEVRRQYPAVVESGSVPLRLKYLNMLINSYLHLSQLDSVAYFIKEGEDVSQGLPLENTGVLGIYEMKADYLERTGNYREALAVLTQFDTPGGNQLMPRDKLLKKMALCHKSMGDYRTAFDLLNRSTEAADSLRSQKAERELSEFTVRYETKEKELEIVRLKEEKLKDEASMLRITVIMTLIIALLAVALLVLLYRRKLRRQKMEIMLAKKYIDGLESERARLARELHDGACNDLLAIGMEISMPDSNKEQIAARIRNARTTLRNISHELMPPSFSNVDLEEMLADYVEHLAVPETLRVEFEAKGEGWAQIPSQVAYEYFRITQEAMSNIVKHSNATLATVRLEKENGRLTLVIGDNGINEKNSGKEGIGLRTIKDRADSIGAECQWCLDDSGSRLTVTLNLN